MDEKTARVVFYAVVGLGAVWALYQLWKKVGSVTAPVSNALADWYVALTAQGQMVPQGMILLPSGTPVPVSQLQVQPVTGTNSATFVYAGTQYYLNSPHDANGNWAASTQLAS